jgi:hypothetical protein
MSIRRAAIDRFRGQALLAAAALLVACLVGGCSRVERNLMVTSDPPGALVYLNGQEAGRTPMNKTFIWYGTYDVQVRKDGFKTVNVKEKVWAPWWQIPPIDLLADLLPVPQYDSHKLSYTLTPLSNESENAAELLARGERLQTQLQDSRQKEIKAKQEAALRGEPAADEKQ